MKITDLFILCKWENLKNRQCIKYLFSPLYINCCVLVGLIETFHITYVVLLFLLNLILSIVLICESLCIKVSAK